MELALSAWQTIGGMVWHLIFGENTEASYGRQRKP